MEESAIFDEVVDIVVKGGYDYYIYDLVPLGHALYYLSMASVYDSWIDNITGLRQQMREYDQVAAVIRRDKEELDEDAILNELLYIKDRINKSSRILTDKKMTAFFFVLTAEEMIISDTLKAAELFAKFDVPLSGYIINRVLPAELKDQNIPEYLKNRLTMQEHYLKVIDNRFGKEILARVPEMERDVTGLDDDREGGQGDVRRFLTETRSEEDNRGSDHDQHDPVHEGPPADEVHLLRRQGGRGQDRHGRDGGAVGRQAGEKDAPGLDQPRPQPLHPPGAGRLRQGGRRLRRGRTAMPSRSTPRTRSSGPKTRSAKR